MEEDEEDVVEEVEEEEVDEYEGQEEPKGPCMVRIDRIPRVLSSQTIIIVRLSRGQERGVRCGSQGGS